MDIWLNHPVTKAYLESVRWLKLDIRDLNGEGKFSHPSSADLTMSGTNQALGQMEGLSNAADAQSLIERYGLILIPEEVENDSSN